MPAVPPFATLLAVAALLSALFAGVAWNRRDEPGAIPLVVFHLAVGIGTATYAAEIAATDIGTQAPLLAIWLTAQAIVPPTWLYAALEYAGRFRWTGRRTAALLAVEPVVLVVALVVPQFRHLLYVLPERGAVGSLLPTSATVGPLLVVHLVYLILVALVGSLVLVQLFVRSRHMYRTQAAAVLVAAAAPFTTVLAQALGIAPEIDPSALTWALSGMALTVGLYRFKTLDTVPAAHRAIVRDMPDGALVLDTDGRIRDTNPAARRLLSDGGDLVGERVEAVVDGWESVPGVQADHLASNVPGDDRVSPLDAGTGVAESDGGATGWHEFSTTNGDVTRHLEVQASPFTDRFDRHVGSLVIVRDVTDRKEREQTLARYKTVFETTQDRVYVLDDDGRFSMVNDALAAFLDTDADALVGQPFESILAPESSVPAGFGRQEDAPGYDDAVEVTVETGDGETIPCETRLTPVEFDDVTGSVGYVRDISRRKEVEADLEATSGRLETLVESSPVAIVASDTEGNVETWNPAAEEIFGYDAEAVVGDTAPVIPEDQRERIRDIHERVVDGERFTNVEMPLERADGTQIETSFSIAPQRDADGSIRGTVGILTDITDRKDRERELEATNERLEQFASVVSHDLRNPLQVAQTELETVIATERLDRADSALDALQRMESLIDDVLTLARQGEAISDTEPVSLVTVVEGAWAHVETADATLEHGSLPVVEGDSTRLEELFENLFRNAVEHAGDDVTVVVARRPDGDDFLVADDGPGIPADRRDDLFDLGVTSARDGTGFGLAIVETIAEAHGWTVGLCPESPDPEVLFEDDPPVDSLGGACFEFVFEE